MDDWYLLSPTQLRDEIAGIDRVVPQGTLSLKTGVSSLDALFGDLERSLIVIKGAQRSRAEMCLTLYTSFTGIKAFGATYRRPQPDCRLGCFVEACSQNLHDAHDFLYKNPHHGSCMIVGAVDSRVSTISADIVLHVTKYGKLGAKNICQVELEKHRKLPKTVFFLLEEGGVYKDFHVSQEDIVSVRTVGRGMFNSDRHV